jgi:YVTN family beta-propeller protein
VPNSGSDTVSVIDPRTFRVLRTVRVGRQPQHVVPAWDLKTLWVNEDLGNSLTPINPRTGFFGRPVAVSDPYNLYFTPDGRYAVVMAERLRRIDFRDPHTMALHDGLHVPCAGVNHADFSADGTYFLVSCEFSGEILKVGTASHKLLAELRLPGKEMSQPQDVKLSSDGRLFYVADMMRNGVWLLDGAKPAVVGFLRTGRGAHGLYVTRDSASLLVTNRGEGSISVIDLKTRRVRTTWRLPGGGSPDMGGISADGRTFWVSGRYNDVVYAVSTTDGHLIRRIRVGAGPHGLCIYPQPGRFSLGHTGVFR